MTQQLDFLAAGPGLWFGIDPKVFPMMAAQRRSVRTAPEAPPLALPADRNAFVRACLQEYTAAHDCLRRAECYARKLEGLDSPTAQHERLSQQELVDHHRTRMERIVAALTARISA